MGCSDIDVTCSPPSIAIPPIYNASSDFVDRHLNSELATSIAVIDDRGSYTYSNVAERINRTGNALSDLGIKREDRVAIALLDGVDFPAVFWGCIKAGIVPIPLNTLLPSSDYQYILNDSGAKTLIVSEELLEKFGAIIDNLPHLKNILVSGSQKSKYPLLSEISSEAQSQMETADTKRDDIAFWLYSSGSTGTPKGVMHRHSSLVQTAVLYGKGILGINKEDIVFSAAKLFFAYGLGNGMSFPFLVGATSILMSERPTPETVLKTINKYKPTIFYGVPSLYAAILDTPSIKLETDTLSLRVCISAGEALPEEIGQQCEHYFDAPILDGIGSTEMLHIFLSNTLDDVVYGSSGKPVAGYELKLRDEQDNDIGIDEIGELIVNGPSSALAYWGQKEKSRHAFRDGWTYTGDKYTMDTKGYYYYCGRTDDMIKVSGQWVSPFEVESTLLEHNMVAEAAVIAQNDENSLIKPKAFVVLKSGIEKSDDLALNIKEFVKAKIARHKYPRWLEFVDNLPKTATGKIQRYKLRP